MMQPRILAAVLTAWAAGAIPMSRARELAGISRSEARDIERTRTVARRALGLAKGSVPHAAARLRHQAAEAAEGASTAIINGAGTERGLQLLDTAARRLRAAELLTRGELGVPRRP